jgi:hypothetical protein
MEEILVDNGIISAETQSEVAMMPCNDIVVFSWEKKLF